MTPTIPQSPRPASAGVEVRPVEAASARGRSGPAGEVSVSVVSSRLVNTLNKYTRKSSKTNYFFKVYAHPFRTYDDMLTHLNWVEPFNIKIIQTSPLFTIHSLLWLKEELYVVCWFTYFFCWRNCFCINRNILISPLTSEWSSV